MRGFYEVISTILNKCIHSWIHQYSWRKYCKYRYLLFCVKDKSMSDALCTLKQIKFRCLIVKFVCDNYSQTCEQKPAKWKRKHWPYSKGDLYSDDDLFQ